MAYNQHFFKKDSHKKAAKNLLQIIHSHRDHWLVASTVGRETGVVKIYDSVYFAVADDTKEVVLNLFYSESNIHIC